MTITKHEDTSAEYLKYAAQERANLIASGITDDDTINAEINRRWSVAQSASKKATSSATPKSEKQTVTLPIMLDEEGLANLLREHGIEV